jgi:hypothetical protein
MIADKAKGQKFMRRIHSLDIQIQALESRLNDLEDHLSVRP